MGSVASYNKTRFHKESDWLRLARIDARERVACEHSEMPPLTYANCLDLEKLLTFQKPRSTPAEHDEMLNRPRRRRSNRRTPHTMRINMATAIIASARRL